MAQIAAVYGWGKLPKGVDAGDIVYQAAEAVPVIMDIVNGDNPNPQVVQTHIDRAIRLNEMFEKSGTKLPKGFLSFVNNALVVAGGGDVATAPQRIRAAFQTPEVQRSANIAEAYLKIPEQHEASELDEELAAFALKVQDTAITLTAQGRSIDPSKLGWSIHHNAERVVSGKFKSPMIKGILDIYMGQTGKNVTIPAFEDDRGDLTKTGKNLTAAAKEIMQTLIALTPEDKRDPAFMAKMTTNFKGAVGGFLGVKKLTAIGNNVGPLIATLGDIFAKTRPAVARKGINRLFGRQ
jgi:hypothetical protein